MPIHRLDASLGGERYNFIFSCTSYMAIFKQHAQNAIYVRGSSAVWTSKAKNQLNFSDFHKLQDATYSSQTPHSISKPVRGDPNPIPKYSSRRGRFNLGLTLRALTIIPIAPL